MDDEKLGMTLKACDRVKQNAKNALNKLNQQGGKNTWTRHMTAQKCKIGAQIKAVNHVHALLTQEFDKRMAEQEAPKTPEQHHFPAEEIFVPEPPKTTTPPVEPDVTLEVRDAPEQEFTEPAGANLYELFCDTPQKELYELAYKGLEAGKSQISPEELADLREDVKVTNALCEELRRDIAVTRDSLGAAKEGKKKAEVELKKLRRVLKGVQTEAENTANRLRKYTEEKETT